MTSWTFAGNHLPQYRSGSIYLCEQPWWLAFCEWVIECIIGHGCCLLHWAKFSDTVKIVRSGEECSLREYYGDLGQIYHLYVYEPLFYWHEGHPRRKETIVEIGYDRMRELFEGRNPKYFAEHDEWDKEDGR